LGEYANGAQFEYVDQITDADFVSAQVEQYVHHQLPRAMISDLTAAVALNDGDIAGVEQMFGFAADALGKYRRVFHKPHLIVGGLVALVGEGLHRLPDFGVVLLAEISDHKGQVL
jgi:hypothetical protein